MYQHKHINCIKLQIIHKHDIHSIMYIVHYAHVNFPSINQHFVMATLKECQRREYQN